MIFPHPPSPITSTLLYIQESVVKYHRNLQIKLALSFFSDITQHPRLLRCEAILYQELFKGGSLGPKMTKFGELVHE